MDHALTTWLLAGDLPTIHYLALKHLVGLDEGDDRVRSARSAIMSRGPVPRILAAQAEDGHWPHERGYYTPKYTSSHWSMLLLAELAADGADERLRRGAESMLRRTDDELRDELDAARHGLACFWGNLLRYALHAGLEDDPRVRRIVAYITLQAGDTGWRCRHSGDLPCAWGAARALWGLGGLSSRCRGEDVSHAIASAADLLLGEGRLIDGAFPSSSPPHALWRRLNAMLFYQADVLFVLRALGDVGALARPDAVPALGWLQGRADTRGRWRGAHPYARRTWPLFGDREDVDRWVSLQAALVLQRAGKPTIP